jgi:valyl-tRNA synthetase
MRFVKDNIVMGKKFCNKIWNATRFVLIQVQTTNRKPQNYSLKLKTKSLASSDKKILKTLDKTIKVVNKNLNNFEFGKVTHILYDFFWHDFCDKYIESAKLKVQNAKNKKEKEQAIRVLLYVLVTSLKLLHPFIPFITEEIYQTLPIKNKQKCLMVETWPK